MAISEFEQLRYEKLLQDFCKEQGPPPHLQDKLKWGFEVDPKKQTVKLFEIRPHFKKSKARLPKRAMSKLRRIGRSTG